MSRLNSLIHTHTQAAAGLTASQGSAASARPIWGSDKTNASDEAGKLELNFIFGSRIYGLQSPPPIKPLTREIVLCFSFSSSAIRWNVDFKLRLGGRQRGWTDYCSWCFLSYRTNCTTQAHNTARPIHSHTQTDPVVLPIHCNTITPRTPSDSLFTCFSKC